MNTPFLADFYPLVSAWLGQEAESFFEALKEDPPLSVRLNPYKTQFHPPLPSVPWSVAGYYLDRKIPFTFDPLFHAGFYYVQEASSMFLEQVFLSVPHKGVRILDLCASPGGKSTHLLSLMDDESCLVSNEPIKTRASVLVENVTKWGVPRSFVSRNYPGDFASLRGVFDFIFADVPCSGEGMFRKDPDAVAHWSLNNVKICAQRQRQIISDVWPALRSGGFLVYSTCTYNPQEDEENVEWIARTLGAIVRKVPLDPSWGVTAVSINEGEGYHFYPHKTKGEGFFIALLEKTGQENWVDLPVKRRDKTVSVDRLSCRDWICHPQKKIVLPKGELIWAVDEDLYPFYQQLSSCLDLIHPGVPIGMVKGKDIVPCAGLVFSQWFDKEGWITVDLTENQAISFLRKEALSLSVDVPKGLVCVTFQGVPLGFVKQIGNRANNLYEDNWRIRSGYLPQKSSLWIDTK